MPIQSKIPTHNKSHPCYYQRKERVYTVDARHNYFVRLHPLRREWGFETIDTYEKYRPYLVFRKFGWGLSLSWITFSCVKGYGGIINDFLSWGLWTPISKISFMTYLFHMSFNYYYYLEQGYNVDVSFWLFTEIFVSQLIVCLFYGIIGCLTLELPYGKIQKLLISQLVGGK